MIHSLLNNYNFPLEYNTEANVSWSAFYPPIIELAQGAEYTILINDKEYVLIAQFAEEEGREIVFIGNPSLGAEVPFLLQYVYDIDSKTYSNFFYHNGNLKELSITITTDLEKANVIFYNKKGKPVEYAGVETISADTVISGAQAIFTRGELIAPPVESLDMTNGDQIVHANGKMFKQITILKPAELIPENIKKHVKIGGVEGSFAGDEVEKTAELDYSIEYTKAYKEADMIAFKTEENVGKYIRVMYKPEGLDIKYTQFGYYQCVLLESEYTLQEIPITEMPTKDNVIVEADEDTVLTKVILPRPEALKSENIRRNTDIGGVTGSYIGDGYTYEEQKLVFNNGKMEIVPEQLKLFEKVIILQPNNLTSANIKQGVTIAGVEGSYALEGLPSLYAPSALNNLTNWDSTSYPLTTGDEGQGAYLSVTNPASNGYFAKTCQLFAVETNSATGEKRDIPVAEKAVTQGSSTVKFYAKDWIVDSLPKSNTLKAQFFGDSKFLPSSKITNSNLSPDPSNENVDGFGGIGLSAMEYNITNGDVQYHPEKIYFGQYVKNKILTDTTYYPKRISIIMPDAVGLGTSTINMLSQGRATYNNKNGEFTISHFRANLEHGERIQITAECPTLPWLQDFSVSPTITDGILTIPRSDPKATRAEVRLGEKIIYSNPYEPYPEKTLTVPASYRTTYTTPSNENDVVHSMASSGSSYGYHIYRCTFKCEKPTTLVITYSQYNYTTYMCGFISKLDYKFSSNYNAESSSNCLFYGSKSSSTTVTDQKLTVQIPAGEHTIDFKWRGYYSYTSYYFRFSLKFPSEDDAAIVDLKEIPNLRAPGEYSLKVSCERDGYIGSDPVILPYVSEGATVEGETLITAGEIEEEVLIPNYCVVDDEVLICNVPNVEMDNDTLVVSGTVEDETVTAEEMIINNETIIYGTPKEE